MRRFCAIVTIALLGIGGLASVYAPQFAAAQAGTVWTVEYFNNTSLSGQPVGTQQVEAVAFNWGMSVPATGVNPDFFSARLTADIYFPQGTYRFYILADDAVQLLIDAPVTPQPVLDSFNNPQPGEVLSVDVPLLGGYHRVQLNFREDTGASFLYLSWANVASSPAGPDFPPSTHTPGIWLAEYYPNPNLSGQPALTRYETDPSNNWETGRPALTIPADYFSARWTSSQVLDAGRYEITVRADDGVRVYVDDVLLINEFHTAVPQSFTSDINLGSGEHTFAVEFFEATERAFINYTFQQIGAPQPQISGPSATVLAVLLNVRSAPNATFSYVIAQVHEGETYPIVGRSRDFQWWQINVNGLLGWVEGQSIAVNNEQNVPATDQQPTPQPTPVPYYTVTAQVNLNVRSAPSTSSSILTLMSYGQQAQVIGRTADGAWWQVRYNGITGWVSAYFSQISTGADLNRIPVTG